MSNMKKDKNLMIFRLNNDPMTKGITTFKDDFGRSLLLVILPSDLKEWENVIIVYKKHSHSTLK